MSVVRITGISTFVFLQNHMSTLYETVIAMFRETLADEYSGFI
jgi:hypothetical protein